MYLVMLTTKQKVWVDRHLARQLQLKNRILFIVREEEDRPHRGSSKKTGENGGTL